MIRKPDSVKNRRDAEESARSPSLRVEESTPPTANAPEAVEAGGRGLPARPTMRASPLAVRERTFWIS